jgi:flagellin-like hook-associated protein FlgL
MFADIETLAHGIRHEAFKNGQRLKKISNTDSAERSAFFNKNSLGAGMATSLTNENRSKRNSINSFQNAITYMQSQKGALSHADELFTRMRELAHEASSGMISQKQRDILSNEFNALKGLVTELSNETVNGVNLFDSRASSIKYDINFGEAFTHDAKSGEGITVTTEDWDGTNNWKVIEVSKDTLYNSGIFTLSVNPGGAEERFLLHQGDRNNPIFDSGRYVTKGNAKEYDFDNFLISYGPNQPTSFKFVPSSQGEKSPDGKIVTNQNPDDKFDNKEDYLNQLFGDTTDIDGKKPSDGDYRDTSGLESKLNYEYTNADLTKSDIRVYESDPNKTEIFLAVYTKTWFYIDAGWSLPELEKQIVGNPSDAQVQLNQLGLGLMRENDGEDFKPVSIDSVENAMIAFEVMGEELANVQSQFGKISSNMSRVEASINIAESNIGGSEKTLSQITNAGLEDDALAISKSRIYRSKSAALLTQAMSVNQDVANFLL